MLINIEELLQGNQAGKYIIAFRPGRSGLSFHQLIKPNQRIRVIRFNATSHLLVTTHPTQDKNLNLLSYQS